MSHILETLALRDTPVYKISRQGSQYCSLPDLLAIVMGGPEQFELAYALLAKFRSLSRMTAARTEEFEAINGVGPALAARIKAALELGRRLMMEAPGDWPTIRSPGDASAILMPELSHLEREHFVVLILNTRNQMTSKITVYQGSISSTHILAGEVYQEAVRCGASCIIVAHNHPSGDPTPSPEDVAITRQLWEAGELLGIKLLDHMIFGAQRYVSLKERGLGFE